MCFELVPIIEALMINWAFFKNSKNRFELGAEILPEHLMREKPNAKEIYRIEYCERLIKPRDGLSETERGK